ncbi:MULTISPECIES: type VI secretion system membrane subunit TssM [unclassified Pseudomonas]|uniref:type VI secretion system membrane subunit TssM n=1 Tax=unclassified Pseudomonas TaxID=196821 RepID=UPI0035BEC2EA
MSQFLKLLRRLGVSRAMHPGVALPLLLGLAAVLVLVAIWWLGPQWAWRGQQPLASVAHRGIVSLLLVLVPLLCWLLVLRMRLHRLQAERRQRAEIERDPCRSLIQAQETALNRGLADYLDNAGGRRALYGAPWYLVLGAQSAGKSTFISRSNQRFSLTRTASNQMRSGQVVEGAYPVRWWVGDDAVIIDPPGAFIEQDVSSSDTVERAGNRAFEVPSGAPARLWLHLLGWLARNRSRRALNGVLLVVDLPALAHAAPDQRMALAHVLRTRLHEVSSQLGARLPLYVILSKFDLLDGFDQCFARLTVAERERVLGFTFKLDPVATFDAWLDECAEHYDRLTGALYEQVLERLSQASLPRERERLVTLHAQLTGLRPALMSFLRETLASDRLTTPALVRGVYWSSVLQHGQISNAFIREAAQPYETQPPLRESKPQGKNLVYFAQQVFQRVIYREAGLAADNIKVARHKRQLLWASSAAGVLMLAVAVTAWHRYFDINQAKAASVLTKSREYRHQEVDQRLDPTGRNLLGPLEQIRDAVSVYGDYRSAWPLLADFGLYQGRAIGPMVDQAYLSLLSRRFLPALASGVVDAMNAAPAGSEQQMAALRVLRMLEDRTNRRPELVEAWMAERWQVAYPGQGQLQRDLMRHLKYALAYADTDLPQYRQQVEDVQALLRKVPMAQRVYASIKQRADEQLHAGLNIRNQVGPAFDVVYRSVHDDDGTWLAPLLTAKGFKEHFEPRSQHFADMAMIDQWALGEREHLDYSDADREALAQSIRTLYGADYINSWRRALNAFAIADFNDLNHGVSILEQLTGPAAPLHRLLETVRENTFMLPVVPAGRGLDASALVEVQVDTPDQQQALGIRRAFLGLGSMLEAEGDKPSYYDETLGAIVAVHDYAKAVQDSSDPGRAALQAVLQRFSMTGPDPIGTLQRVASGLPEPVRQQVRKLAEQTALVLNIKALRELERRWDVEVYSFFQQRLAGRYPFVAQAPDASLEDFEAFFGPKGRLQQFQAQYLKVFLGDNLDALRSDAQGGSLIRPEVIEQLAGADRIRETFFDQRGNLNVQFSIEPLGLSANQRTSLLDLDGQLISYTHGPRQITGIVWPNTLGQQVRSNLTLLRLNGNSSSLEYRGPWSMYRLFSRGSLNGRTATSVDLSFKTGDGVMRYRLNSEKAFNPITQQPFKGFRLPRALLRSDTPRLQAAMPLKTPI